MYFNSLPFNENAMKTRGISVNFTVVKSKISVYSIYLSDETKRQRQKKYKYT